MHNGTLPYSPRQVQSRFEISRQTVSNWASEFARHLSIHANPPAGQHRSFTDSDLEVFALIKELKSLGRTYAHIHATLDAGQRGSVQIEPVPKPGDPVALIEDLKQSIKTLREYGDKQALAHEITRLKAEKEMLERVYQDQQAAYQKLIEELMRARKGEGD